MVAQRRELTERCDLHALHTDRMARVQGEILSETHARELAAIFAALGDPTRVKLLFALSRGELCVCDLAVLLGTSVSAVSHQLRTLRDLRMVTHRRAGRQIYYSLDDHHVAALLQQGIDHIGERDAAAAPGQDALAGGGRR